ncbi:ribonuclease H [Coprinopsis marcescibilis]|uniref:Ribonuclease H n=1 Tax=Coprinopsis marcescibilis TaxID=230819 RepID=A0A5C3KPE1_COPMA|nr:ribonuclease H [Coprinopsis marcescibilis]
MVVQDTPGPGQSQAQDAAAPAAAAAGEWTKIEKRKKKKVVKTETKRDNTQPKFMYSNHDIVKRNWAIGIEDIRDLALHLVADAPPASWLRVENGQQVQRVVVLMVPGLTNDMLGIAPIPTKATTNPNIPLSIPLLSSSSSAYASAIPFIAKTFSHACPTRAPGDANRMHSVMSTFFSSTVTAEERKRRMNQKIKAERPKDDPSQYLLSLEQMIENEYPIPSYMADIFERPPGWVQTPEPAKRPDGPAPVGQQKVYAIDCEMCITEDGKELTRVCIIDYYTDTVVYDQFVKPAKPITDYLTRFSGITAEHLVSTTTTLADVQAFILRLLSPSASAPTANPFSMPASSSSTATSSPTPTPTQTPAYTPTPILLGHSLESDLKALKLIHPLCIDTALTYHHPRGRPLKPGLAWLTKKWCGREIQTRGEGGHDPEEDARACVELLRRKLAEGPGFGEFKVDQESIFERMGRAGRRGPGGKGGKGAGGTGVGGGVRGAVVDYGNPGAMHGSKATTALGCKSDEEVVDGVLGVVGSHDFVFGRLMGLADRLGWITQRGNNANANANGPSSAPTPTPTSNQATPDEIQASLKMLNEHLQTIHSALPPRTALLIFTGHSDPRRMTQLSARKNQFEQAMRAGGGVVAGVGGEEPVRWTSEDGRALEEAVELTKRGLLFVGVKS